jgi:dTDP-4-amino-4,6-dideoxygalactose transaminase
MVLFSKVSKVVARAPQGQIIIGQEEARDTASPVARDGVDTRPIKRFVAKQRIHPLSYLRVLANGTIQDEERFLAKLSERFGSDTTTIPIGRARTGIYLLSKLALSGGRRKVLMSPFTIPDVVTMVVLAGGEPVFYDFEANSTACSLQTLETLIDKDTACVIVTHYHINEPRLSEIAAICRSSGAYLFDDCAIAFGGEVDGRPVGTLTDASVFSLSSYKLLNYFWGGLVTTRRREIAQWLTDIVSAWPRLDARSYIFPIKACLRYDLASRPILFNSLVFPRIQERARRTSLAQSLEPARIETSELNPTLTSRPSLQAFAEWASKIDRIEGLLANRRRIVAIYRNHLGGRMVGAGAPRSLIDGSCFVNFPVIVPSERCNEIVRTMMLAGYDVGRTLYPNAHRHPKFTSVKGRSDNIDRMVASTIYLPTHFGVSEGYANSIAARLAQEIGL